MKKILCVLLAVIMVFSSAFIMNASAASYVVTNPIEKFSSYDELINYQPDKEVYGYTVDYLYNSSLYVDWSKLNISYLQDGNTVKTDKGEWALAKADMNSYLKRIVNNLYSGDKLYTEEYATVLVNFFGNLVYPNFTEKSVSFGTNETPNEDEFFKIVAVESGLSEVIQANWCNDPDIDFKSLLSALGVVVQNIPDNRFGNGVHMATEFVRGIVNSFIANGPIDFAINYLWTFSKSYEAALYKPVTALLSLKINAGSYSPEELRSMDGILNLLFGNMTAYRFVKFPTSRLTNALDQTEASLFLMMYFAINYQYGNNADVVDGLVSKLDSIDWSSGGYDSNAVNLIKSNISGMVECIFKGNISIESINMINNLTEENMDSVPTDIFSSLRNYFAKIFRRIADYFDYLIKLFNGDIKYGEDLIK